MFEFEKSITLIQQLAAIIQKTQDSELSTDRSIKRSKAAIEESRQLLDRLKHI